MGMSRHQFIISLKINGLYRKNSGHVSRMTRLMAFIGLAVVVVSIPAALFGDIYVPWFGVLILIFAPTFVELLQFAFLRTLRVLENTRIRDRFRGSGTDG
jgi:fatty acid desaturase